ncbi:MAG TPA: RagB/SusD family nutrient uptake outer membrane protein [Gemmatimonadaceae bacterium]|nr:RagB/SusD family nutrient uptake outer membrane protein [Gemmatimonadaceae bacterium]
MRLGPFRNLVPLAAALALVAVVPIGGCKDFLVEEPEDFFSPENFPSTEADLKIALGGIDNWYTGGTNQPYFIRGWPMISEVPSDQTVYTRPTDVSRYEQDTYTMNAANEWHWRVWRQMYGAIQQANLLIERIPQMGAVPQAVKDRYLGAAKFHRALNHFNAVRVWGSVPVMLAPVKDFAAAAGVTRAPIADVYAAIAADLEDAARLLPVRWPDSATPDDGRPARGAANAMLADAYMNMAGYQGVAGMAQSDKWAKAAAAAKAVIDGKAYSLVPNFADLWLIKNKNGPEHIFSIQFQGTIRNLFTSQSRPSGIGAESGINYWYTTADFMDTFLDADARKAPTFLTQVTVGTRTYYYDKTSTGGTGAQVGPFGDKRDRGPGFERFMPYYGKFYDANGTIANNNGRTDLNWPIYRYADVLLMFAEAENEANGPTAAAFDAINLVRARAKLPALSGLGKDELRAAVRQERSWELAFESKRLFDLKRWGLFYEVLKNDRVAKVGIKPTHIFLPIPQRELDLNPALGQNAGY